MSASIQFQKLVEEYFRELWREDPIAATSVGIHDFDNELPHFDEGSLKKRAQSLRTLDERLTGQIHPDQLTLTEQLDLRALRGTIESELLNLEQFQWHKKLPSVYLDSALFGILLLLVHDFAPLPERARKVLGRLRELPRLLKEGSQQIQDAPALYLEIGIEILQHGKAFLNQMIPALAERVPELSSQLDNALKEANLGLQAFGAFQEVLKDTSRDPFGVGEKLFLLKMKADFEMEVSCRQLVQQAKETMTQIRAELEKLKKETRSDEELPQLFATLKKQLPRAQDLIDFYRQEVTRAREWILQKKLAPIAAGELLEVVPTPEFERSTTPYAAYLAPAPFENRQKGFFWVTPISESSSQQEKLEKLQGHCIPGIPVTVAHEAYPGHHLQLSYANQLKSLFRKATSNTMTCEGWGHYSEHLMNEEGFYQDVSTRLFFLKDALWRCCRVLVDVGLHTQGMTIDEASQLLVTEAFLEPANALVEVKRYAISPTQPLCYFIGKSEILKLRKEYQQKQGASFSLYEFHERFLRASSLPLPLIRQELLA